MKARLRKDTATIVSACPDCRTIPNFQHVHTHPYCEENELEGKMKYSDFIYDQYLTS